MTAEPARALPHPIPFLRPRLPELEEFEPALRRMQAAGRYTNFGPLCEELQTRVADELFGGEGMVTAVANATLGLSVALGVLARPTGRYVVMPSFTFAATPQAAAAAGFEPYFVDVDPQDWTVRFAEIERVVDQLGDDVAAVMPYATFGTPMDLVGFAALHRRGVPVVIDAASSLGSGVDQQFGRGFPGAVVFSMHATKAFGIGEGGLVYSATPETHALLRSAANFGFGPDRAAVRWGTNAKLSELACAVALAVLDAFRPRVAERMALYQAYLAALARDGLTSAGLTTQATAGTCAHQFMPVLLPEGTESTDLVRRLAASGIEARTYFSPACHQQPQFDRCPRTALPVTEALGRRILSLPLWEGMGPADINAVVDAVAEASR